MDVQWRVENAEGADWMYITTNTDWDQCESAKCLWAILRTYDEEGGEDDENEEEEVRN